METTTIKQDIETLNSHAEQYRDTDRHVIESMRPGETWWQGDLGIQYLGTTKPHGIVKDDKPQPKLAPGETKGSRHMLVNIDECRMHKLSESHPLTGPIIETPQGVEVEHPEHGDVVCKEPGWYAIRYQRAYDVKELHRVAD